MHAGDAGDAGDVVPPSRANFAENVQPENLKWMEMDGKWPGLKSQNPKVSDSQNLKLISSNQR